MRGKVLLGWIVPAGMITAAGLAAATQLGASAAAGWVLGPAVDVSSGCHRQNAEVETAIDPATGNLYEEWIGCGGIGFARSTNGGRSFGPAFELPRSGGGWDPAITVGPNGAVYAAFMVSSNTRSYPVVEISTNHGQAFPAVRPLVPPRRNNWGDRDFIAVAPDGTIYVTWDYGPKNDITFTLPVPGGSGSFAAGDINVVVQRSANGGATWSKIIPISPGFPGSGADSAPILVEPSGRLDVLYQGYNIVNRRTLRLGVAHSYFTTSTDNGLRWSKPLRLGPKSLSMNTREWWIDGSLGIDAAGNLYAAWDTQSGGRDIGWLAFSTTRGRTWSRPRRVTPDTDRLPHIVQVLGGRSGIAYVGWLTDSHRCGRAKCYAQYLRVFKIGGGGRWITPIIGVSGSSGNWQVWPGDTIGLSLFAGGSPGKESLAVSWGSAVGGKGASDKIWASVVSQLP